ncbi:hypothetical protein [Nitrospira sp. Nam74]
MPLTSPSHTSASYDLQDVIDILREADNKKLYEMRKVKPTFIDSFLFSGKFNSVLGLDGFQRFKDALRDLIKRVNNDDFGANYINLDTMYEVLLVSGVYYVEQYLPQELSFLKKDDRWLTAYRYIAKHFPSLTYADFREIVKRFQDTDGHSFYVSNDDPEALREMARTQLFREVVDAKGMLLQLSMKELQRISEEAGVRPARSIEETADRIVAKIGQQALALLPAQLHGHITLFIKDEELATGEDLIHLHTYLRAVAKVVREDLVAFINKQRIGVVRR